MKVSLNGNILNSWKDQQGRSKTGRTGWESGELSGEFMEENTIERATKTEIDAKTAWKKFASSVGLCQGHKQQHPHHVKVSPQGPNLWRITLSSGWPVTGWSLTRVVCHKVVSHQGGLSPGTSRLAKGSTRRFFLSGRDRAIVNQTNTGTMSTTTLGKLSERPVIERMWGIPGA